MRLEGVAEVVESPALVAPPGEWPENQPLRGEAGAQSCAGLPRWGLRGGRCDTAWPVSLGRSASSRFA